MRCNQRNYVQCIKAFTHRMCKIIRTLWADCTLFFSRRKTSGAASSHQQRPKTKCERTENMPKANIKIEKTAVRESTLKIDPEIGIGDGLQDNAAARSPPSHPITMTDEKTSPIDNEKRIRSSAALSPGIRSRPIALVDLTKEKRRSHIDEWVVL